MAHSRRALTGTVPGMGQNLPTRCYVEVFTQQLELYLCLCLYFEIKSVHVPVQLKLLLMKPLYETGTMHHPLNCW